MSIIRDESELSETNCPATRRIVSLEWTVCWADDPAGPWSTAIPAAVPGHAQFDLAISEGINDIHFGDNWRYLSNWEDRWWCYATTVVLDASMVRSDERALLVLEGVDYACDIFLDQKYHLGSVEGMHAPWHVDLSDRIFKKTEPFEISVRIRPAPKAKIDGAWGHEWAASQRSQARHSTKPSVSYGEDFHPRVIPQGLWQDAYVEIQPIVAIRYHQIDYELNADFSKAFCIVRVEVSSETPSSCQLRLSIEEDDAIVTVICSQVTRGVCTIDAEIINPRLWWPNGHGEPFLYRYFVELLTADGVILDSCTGRFGLRKVELIMHEGAWDYPTPGVWPKGRSNPPMCVTVNGRSIFARGACCLPLQIFYGRVTEAECRAIVLRAVEANFNMLRNSGGCVCLKPAFYDACDELGILVWQDFPLSCNQYPDGEEYLSLLEREARAMISKLRKHPSVAIWCGGNELFEYHSGMTDQALALRLLNALTFELDRSRPFLASTPLKGMVHGPYEFVSREKDADFEAGTIIQRSIMTAIPEFGCPALPSTNQLKSIIPDNELFPPEPGTAWEDHKAFRAFDGVLPTWLNLHVLESYFGVPASLDCLVKESQMIQGEVLRAIFEEARRKQPTCSLSLMWALNEPWPNACGLSLLEWPARPKDGFYKVRDACRPVLASLRAPRIGWSAGEAMKADLWILSDFPYRLDGGRLEVLLRRSGRSDESIYVWDFPDVPEQRNLVGPPIEITAPKEPGAEFSVVLQVDERPEWTSSYQFVVFPDSSKALD